jgi:hypothetical protein
MTYRHTTVRIADKIFDVFLDNSTDDKFYDLTSVAHFTGKTSSSTFRFFSTRSRLTTLRLDGRIYILVPCEYVSEYLMHTFLQGNLETQKALLNFFTQSLKMLGNAAFKEDDDVWGHMS